MKNPTHKPGSAIFKRAVTMRHIVMHILFALWLVGAHAAAAVPRLKVAVDRPDIYGVAFAALAAELDWPVADVADAAATALLELWTGDREPVAYAIDPDEGRLLFYGEPFNSPYTRDTIYWIEPGPGLRMTQREPETIAVPTNQTFPSLNHWSEDKYLMVDVPFMREDLYFWEPIYAGWSGWDRKTLPVPLDGYAGGDLLLTVFLTGRGESSWTPDYEAVIRFNNSVPVSFPFNVHETIAASVTVPASLIAPNGNVVEVVGNLQPGQMLSFFAIEALETVYQRHYAPAEHFYVASDGGHARLSAALFADPVVIDITQTRQPQRVRRTDGSLAPTDSWSVAHGSMWAFRERAQIVNLIPETGGFGADLRAATNAVDYLIIAPRAFAEPAQALAAHRREMGLRARTAWIEDIYDQFTAGIRSPEAIRELLRYAAEHWEAAPWMVFLAGRGHLDYLGRITDSPNHLPPLLGVSPGALRAADNLLADLTGNGLPDVALGRLPARTVAQFEGYLDKVFAYERNPPRPSHQQAVFVADNADGGGNYTQTNLQLGEQAAGRYTVTQYSRDWDPASVVRAQMENAFRDGVGLIHYTGHGNTQILGDNNERLLSREQAELLDNPPVPLFVALSCMVGRFDMPGGTSLGEALVLREGGGALAVFAPGGNSWNVHTAVLGEWFHHLHGQQHAGTLGPTLGEARTRHGPLAGAAAASMSSYNLLGDPALKLAGGGTGSPSWADHYHLWRWERFSNLELADPLISGPHADPLQRGWNNLTDYAFGGLPPWIRIADQPAASGYVRLWWCQRENAQDLTYRLRAAPNPSGIWMPAPEETLFSSRPAADPGMIIVDAEVPLTDAIRFFRLKVEVE